MELRSPSGATLGMEGGEVSPRSAERDLLHPSDFITASTLEIVSTWSTTKLIQAVEGLRKNANQIKTENQLLSSFLSHVLPESPSEGTLRTLQASVTADDVSISPSGRRRSRSSRSSSEQRGSQSDLVVFVNLKMQQKVDIACKEVDLIREKLREQRKKCTAIINDCNLQLEETQLSEEDLKRSKEAFRRGVENAPNPTTGTIMAEKVLKYFEQWGKMQASATERYRLSNSILGHAIKRLHTQIKQKEELGDTMREVDYNQLIIENAQYQEKLEERNQALIRLKHVLSVALQSLGQHNAKLQQLIVQSNLLSSDISQREEALTKIATEIQAAEEEQNKTCRQVQHMKEQLDNFRVVDVMDYVEKQAELYELQREVAAWDRKVNVMRKSVQVQSGVEKRARIAARAAYQGVTFDEIDETHSS